MQEATDADSVSANPDRLVLKMFAGADGKLTLYEDDNVSCDYEKGICAETEYELVWNGEQKIVIHPAHGKNVASVKELIPEQRSYRIELYGCTDAQASCLESGKELSVTQSYDEQKHCLIVEIPATDAETEKTVTFSRPLVLRTTTRRRTYPVSWIRRKWNLTKSQRSTPWYEAERILWSSSASFRQWSWTEI